ncbi:pectin lyase fold/virulence factor [Plectosphaerella plurivora]|uniref:Pectin lyase fold/virulence factor n=1 Tax=Plectosphaerella plurivora TaxID=936078 RepID=A0A9P8V3I0_9PEZI|nr:pectin lyase fold/virulence factor [Plectosphaerella plurivora]
MAKLQYISCLLVATTALLSGVAEAGGHGDRRSTYVKHPASIQKALDRAKPYDTIVVGAGTYEEHLTIRKDGITLIGKDAILVPPTKPAKPGCDLPNDCLGLAGVNATVQLTTGICIQGSGIKLLPYKKEHRKVESVDRYIKDVTVEGFDVRGFDGINIAVLGAKNAKVLRNTASDGGQYGVLTVGSKSTLIKENRVKSASLLFIAICMDDKSDTNGAKVTKNTVSNCCVGAFVDPGIDGAKVLDNTISNTNPICGMIPDVAVSGIAIGGAKNTKVSGNKVTGITDNGNDKFVAAGIAVFDFGDPTPLIPTGNIITGNEVKGGNDQDLLVFTQGTDNKITKNTCDTPAELCKL